MDLRPFDLPCRPARHPGVDLWDRVRQSILMMEEQQPYVQVPEDVNQAVVIQSATLAWDAAGADGDAAAPAEAPTAK